VKLIFTRLTKAFTFVFSAALLMGGQNSANAGQQFHPLQAQRLSHDLVQPNSQDFFYQGQSRLNTEIQILQRRRLSWTKPVLKINQGLHTETDHSPRNSPSVLPK